MLNIALCVYARIWDMWTENDKLWMILLPISNRRKLLQINWNNIDWCVWNCVCIIVSIRLQFEQPKNANHEQRTTRIEENRKCILNICFGCWQACTNVLYINQRWNLMQEDWQYRFWCLLRFWSLFSFFSASKLHKLICFSTKFLVSQ